MKVVVGPRELEIVELPASEREDAYGDENLRQRRIRISPDMPAQESWSVLLHECLHAVVETYNVPLPKAGEEALVVALEQGLSDFLISNPQLVADITAGLQRDHDGVVDFYIAE